MRSAAAFLVFLMFSFVVYTWRNQHNNAVLALQYSVGGAENVIVTDREFYESNIYGHGENNEPKTALYRPFQKVSY